MAQTEQPTEPAAASRSSYYWPVIVFFLVAYLIAWGLIPIFNWAAGAAGVEDGITLMAMTESFELAPIAAELPLPGWFLYLLTRIQDFSFTIAGLFVTGLMAGRAGLSLLGKKFNPRLGSWRWVGLALLLPYGLYGLAAALAIAGDSSILAGADISLQSLWAILFGAQAGLFFYMLLRGGLGEEPGLRGVALTRLQPRLGPTIASFVIGVFWAGWHLPVYIQADVVSVIASLLLAFVFAFMFTFFYNYARESLWVVIVLHAGMNAADNAYELIFPGLAGSDWQIPALLGLLLTGIILGVLMWWRSRTRPFTVTDVL